jgi:hypothetical protein
MSAVNFDNGLEMHKNTRLVPDEKYIPRPTSAMAVSLIINLRSEAELISKFIGSL